MCCCIFFLLVWGRGLSHHSIYPLCRRPTNCSRGSSSFIYRCSLPFFSVLAVFLFFFFFSLSRVGGANFKEKWAKIWMKHSKQPHTFVLFFFFFLSAFLCSVFFCFSFFVSCLLFATTSSSSPSLSLQLLIFFCFARVVYNNWKSEFFCSTFPFFLFHCWPKRDRDVSFGIGVEFLRTFPVFFCACGVTFFLFFFFLFSPIRKRREGFANGQALTARGAHERRWKRERERKWSENEKKPNKKVYRKESSKEKEHGDATLIRTVV